MKILLYTDVHFSQYSSIIRKRGQKYSQRLENIINSLNWVEQRATDLQCDTVLCLGDFFDRSELNSEELSALKDIQWNRSSEHYFIVGNHESNVSSLTYNSTNALVNIPNAIIIDKVLVQDKHPQYNFVYLPYILEEDRKPLTDYLPKDKKNIIFSHNDIKGINYGKFESKEGFDLKEIENNSHLFFNGHLHNGSFLNEKGTILNLGNLTGQNFSEDAFNYGHLIAILEITDAGKVLLDFETNPYAFNFYKIEINKETDLQKLYSLSSNSVVSLKCIDTLKDNVKEILNSFKNIIDHRLVIYQEEKVTSPDDEIIELNSVDYLKQFTDFILDKVGSSDVVKDELRKIVGGAE